MKTTGELDTSLSFPSEIMKILPLNFSAYPVWDAAVWSVADGTLPRTTVANDNLLWTLKGLCEEALTKDTRKQCSVVSGLWGFEPRSFSLQCRTTAPEHTQVFLPLIVSITSKLAYEKGKTTRKTREQSLLDQHGMMLVQTASK